MSVQRDHHLVREYLARREQVTKQWRAADLFAAYTLRLTPSELRELGLRLDGVLRPYLASTRAKSRGTALVQLNVHALPLPRSQ